MIRAGSSGEPEESNGGGVGKTEERQVVYEDADLDELVLSYAISVHKAKAANTRW